MRKPDKLSLCKWVSIKSQETWATKSIQPIHNLYKARCNFLTLGGCIQQTIMIWVTVFRIIIWDTENTDHRKAPTPYTTQIQNKALESELQYLSYDQEDKGNPTSLCKVLSDLEKTEIQKKFPSPIKSTQTLSPDSPKKEFRKMPSA